MTDKENLIELLKNSNAIKYEETVRRVYNPNSTAKYEFLVGTGYGTFSIDFDKLADEILEKYKPIK